MKKYPIVPQILVSLALAIGLVSAGAACDGTAVTFDDTKALSQSSSEVVDGSSSKVNEAMPLFGSDAGSTKDISSMSWCQAVKLLSSPLGDSGVVSYGTQLVNGDSATIEHLGDRIFRVTCRDGDTELLRVTFGPYAGNTDYAIAVGDFVLHGEHSDRPCELSLSSAYPAIRGFVSCDNEPYSDGNIFAQSGAPIGLASFDVLPP